QESRVSSAAPDKSPKSILVGLPHRSSFACGFERTFDYRQAGVSLLASQVERRQKPQDVVRGTIYNQEFLETGLDDTLGFMLQNDADYHAESAYFAHVRTFFGDLAQAIDHVAANFRSVGDHAVLFERVEHSKRRRARDRITAKGRAMRTGRQH